MFAAGALDRYDPFYSCLFFTERDAPGSPFPVSDQYFRRCIKTTRQTLQFNNAIASDEAVRLFVGVKLRKKPRRGTRKVSRQKYLEFRPTTVLLLSLVLCSGCWLFHALRIRQN